MPLLARLARTRIRGCGWRILKGKLTSMTTNLEIAPADSLPKSTATLDPLHAWAGGMDAARLEAWTRERLAAFDAAIAKLLAVEGPRTIENTLRRFDDAANQLAVASNQTYLLYAVGDTPALRDMGQSLAAQISAVATDLGLNPAVYAALAAMDAANADAATRHYLSRTLLQYRLAGVDKDEETRNKLRALMERTTELSLAFGRNVQEDVRKVTVAASDLAGLPQDYLDRHPADADGNVTITTDQPDFSPVMRYAKSSDLRRQLFLAYNQRGYPANQQVLMDLLKTRAEIASILGYKCWADLATADQMMRSAANMKTFLAGLDASSRAAADREYEQLMSWVRAQDASITELTDADAGYWAEQYRRAAYDFDSQSVRPYFQYSRVEAGVLRTVSTLFQVRFQAAEQGAGWDPAVTVFHVYDAKAGSKGDRIGRVYLDMHPREGKDKWFSASSLVPGLERDGRKQVPEATLICNFSGGNSADGDPGLLEYNDVVTYLHEFGHLMHFILGGQQRWTGIGGFSVEGDFIEVPSQMLEEFFRDAKLLQSFAKHFETDQPIPAELVAQMNRANAYGRGRWVQQQLFYTNFALELHDVDQATLEANFDLDATLRRDHDRFLKPAWLEGNRMYASFTHLTGYSSNYYTYLFDKVMAIDFFAQFAADNLLECEAAKKYRATVMEPGGSKPAAELVTDFLGREADMEALAGWIAQG
jgi:thimet oligopeptidase